MIAFIAYPLGNAIYLSFFKWNGYSVNKEFVGIEIKKSLKEKYGGYEIPKKFIFSDEPFTVENGFLTQTLKLKRRLVLEKFKDQIETLYQE